MWQRCAMNTFYWHDYETFGANPARDRPVQFAGLRTDEDLHPVGEPLELFCRPAVDYLPDPDACLITGITPQMALSRGVIEPEFIARIHHELARPGTCGVGYNSIRFDDEVTRYTLYRNFYDPYAREWQAGNSRWDLIDVVRMCYALRPEGIVWPRNDAGRISFKLEHLTAANGIEHQGAHDALSDVRATIALARLLRNSQRGLYDYALGLRDKRTVAKLLGLLDVKADASEPLQARPLLHISSRFSVENGCAALVLPLARHLSNKNVVIVADLSQDPSALLSLDADQLQRRVFSRAKDLGPGETRIAIKQVYLNRSPMLVTPNVLDAPGYDRLGIDRALCERHAEPLLAGGASLGRKVASIFDTMAPLDADPDTQLYAGFLSNDDHRLLEQLRGTNAEQLASFGPRFRDARLAPLLLRYRARNYPATLSRQEAEDWAQWCRRRLTEPELAHGRDLQQYRDAIEKKLAKIERERTLLIELREYGDGLAADHQFADSLPDQQRD
jgi:exodeoxyribonuclease-1